MVQQIQPRPGCAIAVVSAGCAGERPDSVRGFGVLVMRSCAAGALMVTDDETVSTVRVSNLRSYRRADGDRRGNCQECVDKE
jgi:hypothetical protein